MPANHLMTPFPLYEPPLTGHHPRGRYNKRFSDAKLSSIPLFAELFRRREATQICSHTNAKLLLSFKLMTTFLLSNVTKTLAQASSKNMNTSYLLSRIILGILKPIGSSLPLKPRCLPLASAHNFSTGLTHFGPAKMTTMQPKPLASPKRLLCACDTI